MLALRPICGTAMCTLPFVTVIIVTAGFRRIGGTMGQLACLGFEIVVKGN